MDQTPLSSLALYSLDAIDEEILWISEDGQVIYANAHAKAQLKCDDDDIAAGFIWDFRPDLPAEDWQSVYKYVADSKKIPTIKGEHLNKKGESYLVEYTIQLVHGSEGHFAIYRAKPWNPNGSEKPKNYFSHGELQFDSETVFSKVFHYSPIGIVLSDTNGKIRKTNPAYCKFLGYSEAELLEKTVLELIHPDDRQTQILQYLKALEGKESTFSMRKRYLRKNGEIAWGRLTLSIIKDEHGKPLHNIAMIEDITQQIKTELARQQQFREQQVIFNAMPSLFFRKDDQNNIIQCNRKAAESVNMTVEELSGINSRDAFPEHSDKYYLDDLEVLQSGLAKMGIVEPYRANEQDRWLRTDKIPYIDIEGQITGVLVFSTDITDLMEVQEELARKNEELRKYIDSNLQLENFAYIASHDLREPLRTIGNFSQLLERRYHDKLDDEGKEFIHFINQGVRNLNNLIKDLLLFSRVNTNEIDPEAIDLPQLIKGVRINLKANIEETQSQINLGYLPPEIMGNPTKITQLFQNLLANSIKFRKPDLPAQIYLSAEDTGSHWQFCIADNGIGIAEEFQEQIFLLFKKLHHSKQYQGTGIGLSLCKKIVEQHQGEIWLESTLGQGTRFYFTLAKQINHKA